LSREVLILLLQSYSEVLPEFLKHKARSYKKVTPKQGDTIIYGISIKR